jgi:hypothetical protein
LFEDDFKDNLFVHFLVATNVCYFLCLETKKVTKENSRLQIILGLLVFRLAHAIQLGLRLPAEPSNSIAYIKALTASLKTVASPKIL